MKKELELELYNIDPIFFEEAIACEKGELNEMTSCMAFGCECGDGWYEPLKNLAYKTKLLNDIAKNYNFKFICEQLKEKWGECTIYYGTKSIDNTKDIIKNDILNKIFRDVIDACRNECWNICEICGDKQNFRGDNIITTSGYISRICKKCNDK